MIFQTLKNKSINLRNKMISKNNLAMVIPDLVQVSVDPNKDVSVSGEGISSMKRMGAGTNAKYAKFATYKL